MVTREQLEELERRYHALVDRVRVELAVRDAEIAELAAEIDALHERLAALDEPPDADRQLRLQ